MISSKTGNRLRIAVEILKRYDGRKPFHLFLTGELRSRRSGSSDRRIIRQLCYAALRVYPGFKDKNWEKAAVLGCYLTDGDLDPSLEEMIKEKYGLDPADRTGKSVRKRCDMVGEDFKLENVFPFPEKISDKIRVNSFIESQLSQPFTWVRADRGSRAIDKLTSLDTERFPGIPEAFGLSPRTDVRQLLGKESQQIEIQDLSSQRVSSIVPISPGERIWDCCAGAGGKTLALQQIQPKAHFFVSDVRTTILTNLKNRFRQHRFDRYTSAVCDLASGKLPQGKGWDQKMDTILADVPCSGSGTWKRNPESLSNFNKNDLQKYVGLQRKIIPTALKGLAPGGKLVYATCSVYSEENEKQVEWLAEKFDLRIIDMRYFEGYEYHADTMFAATLTFK